MLSAPRRRLIPASLLAAGLALSTFGVTIPAQASTVVVPAASVVAPRVVSRAPAAPRAVTVSPRQLALHAAAVRVARQRTTAVAIARSRVGSAYVAGAAGPRAFDCSGLALYVVKHAFGRTLPHYSRDQFAMLPHVARNHLRPGDLVFFFGYGAHHVGVYIGHGLMVDATNPSGGVRIDPVFGSWFGQRYSGAARPV